MRMNEAELWKNFKLGEELSISGAFIYNGLRRFHEMKDLSFTDEMFEFLYELSIGFERLFKIAIILFEHDNHSNQEKLEASLVTHHHLVLLDRLKNKTKINLGPPHVELLSLLDRFYKSYRYDRFKLYSPNPLKNETEALCILLHKHLSMDISKDVIFGGIKNVDKYRRFIRKTSLKISKILYNVISSRARELNLYTYELRHGSKAETVFIREIDISHEDILWKELLVFLMNTKDTSGYLEFLRSIPPLDFDPALTSDYLDCFQSDASKSQIMDELEHHYQEMEEDQGKRIELINIIGSPDVYFSSLEDDMADD